MSSKVLKTNFKLNSNARFQRTSNPLMSLHAAATFDPVGRNAGKGLEVLEGIIFPLCLYDLQCKNRIILIQLLSTKTNKKVMTPFL